MTAQHLALLHFNDLGLVCTLPEQNFRKVEELTRVRKNGKILGDVKIYWWKLHSLIKTRKRGPQWPKCRVQLTGTGSDGAGAESGLSLWCPPSLEGIPNSNNVSIVAIVLAGRIYTQIVQRLYILIFLELTSDRR